MLVGAATVGKSPDEYCKFLKKKKIALVIYRNKSENSEAHSS